MKFEYKDGQAIPSHKPVRVTKTNHIIEIMSLKTESNGLFNIKKLDKLHYMIKDTGEVLEYNTTENRGQNTAGLKDTFKKIRNLINNNFTGEGNELHVTLTYKENMTDTSRLYSDFKKFWRKYQSKYKNTDYISIVEPQGRGAWHCHVLIKHHNEKDIFIPNYEIAELWGQGFTTTRKLEQVDNIGAYLSAYLTDVELTEENLQDYLGHDFRSKIDLKTVKDKKYIKGGRVHLYPNGMNIYRKSKGINIPEVQKIPYEEIKRIVKSASPNYSKSVIITDNDGNLLNEITYESYNTKKLNIT